MGSICRDKWPAVVNTVMKLRFQYNTVESGYSDIGLYETSSTASDILSYQLIPDS
jgi:hypothetical protein